MLYVLYTSSPAPTLHSGKRMLHITAGQGFGVWGLGFGVWGLGFGVWGVGYEVWGMSFEIWNLCFRF